MQRLLWARSVCGIDGKLNMNGRSGAGQKAWNRRDLAPLLRTQIFIYSHQKQEQKQGGVVEAQERKQKSRLKNGEQETFRETSYKKSRG